MPVWEILKKIYCCNTIKIFPSNHDRLTGYNKNRNFKHLFHH